TETIRVRPGRSPAGRHVSGPLPAGDRLGRRAARPEGETTMPAPATTDDLLALVRKSNLIDPERLDAFLADGPMPASPQQLAAELVRAGLVTQFQSEQFLLGKWRGFTIGKYKVLERLGFGGNGTVY